MDCVVTSLCWKEQVALSSTAKGRARQTTLVRLMKVELACPDLCSLMLRCVVCGTDFSFFIAQITEEDPSVAEALDNAEAACADITSAENCT